MYEPYGEEKKGLGKKLADFKKKLSQMKIDKVTITVIALALLLVTGSISGYIAYTGKISDLQKKNLLMEKEKDSLKADLALTNQKLSQCSNDLVSCSTNMEATKEELTKTALNLQKTGEDLKACNDAKLSLATDLNTANEKLKKAESDYKKLEEKYDNLDMKYKDLQSDYTILDKSYDDLKEDFNSISCNYAKTACGTVGMSYYYLEGNEKVVCCLDENTCVKSPSSKEKIKRITC